MTKTIITKGKLFLGCLDRNGGKQETRNCKAYLEWELYQGEHGPEFSMMGDLWNHTGTDIVMGGQCCDTLVNALPSPKAKRMLKVWEKYHMNGMQAGIPVQLAELATQKALVPAKHPEAMRGDGSVDWHKLAELLGLNEKGQRYSTAGHYDVALHWLKRANLYEVPIHQEIAAKVIVCTGGFPVEVVTGARGYRYGERWVFMSIPSQIVEEIKSWAVGVPETATS